MPLYSIGYAIAERLGLEGASIVICSRSQKNVDEAMKMLREAGVKNVAGIPAHVANAKDREALIQLVGYPLAHC